MPEPVLLEDEFGDHEWVRELNGFGIRFVEQLGPLLATSEGRLALHLQDPRIPVDELQARTTTVLSRRHGITFAAPRAASPLTGLSLLPQRSYGLGYAVPQELKDVGLTGTLPPIPALSGQAPPPPGPPPSPLPPQHDLQQILTPVRNQFHRGACVAFATTALLEAKIRHETSDSLDLSEQYVYYAARQNDPDRREDGTYPRYALDGLQQRGACLERMLPYERFNDWGQAALFMDPAHPLTELDNDARRYRINGCGTLNPNSADAVKQALVNNQPVCVALVVFKYAWYDNGFTESTGEVQMPLTRPNPDGTETLLDAVVGGHAVAIIGYRDTPDPADRRTFRPGGGYFVFKNSWGTAWAANNAEVAAGFGQLPYEYLRKYNMEAYVVT